MWVLPLLRPRMGTHKRTRRCGGSVADGFERAQHSGLISSDPPPASSRDRPLTGQTVDLHKIRQFVDLSPRRPSGDVRSGVLTLIFSLHLSTKLGRMVC